VRVRRALIPLAVALAAMILASAADASARCKSSSLVTVIAPSPALCSRDAPVVDNLETLHPNAFFQRGLRHYRVPRPGPHYQPGQDWHCTVRVIPRYVAAVNHPVSHVRGRCVYPRATRFSFFGDAA